MIEIIKFFLSINYEIEVFAIVGLNEVNLIYNSYTPSAVMHHLAHVDFAAAVFFLYISS